jgi:hypothetical protein
MKQHDFFIALRRGLPEDVIEYLEYHFAPSEMRAIKEDGVHFYMRASEADQDRIWNAVECRMHKRAMASE